MIRIRRKLTDERFIIVWIRAWRAGHTLTELSRDTQIPYGQLVNKFRALLFLGIALPLLRDQQGRQSRMFDRAEKLTRLLADLMAEPVL